MTSSEQRTPSLGRDYFWNTAWSFMVAGATVIMLIIVTRAAGVAAAGVFSIALAIGQQFQTLGMYEVRTYQVTDVQGRFTFGTYLAVRILTVLLITIIASLTASARRANIQSTPSAGKANTQSTPTARKANTRSTPIAEDDPIPTTSLDPLATGAHH